MKGKVFENKRNTITMRLTVGISLKAVKARRQLMTNSECWMKKKLTTKKLIDI